MTHNDKGAGAGPQTLTPEAHMTAHSVEKIGGTSMSRADELVGTLFERPGGDPYGRIFVVSAFGGVTNLLLEDKKTGEPGIYRRFVAADSGHGWGDALDATHARMAEIHGALLDHPADRRMADDFLRERIEGARSCLIDLQRLCSYGHFRLDEHMTTVRELLSGIGEAHSAHTMALMLRRAGFEARFVDLTGWRDDSQPSLEERIRQGFEDVDLATEMPIVTGYAQCREGLVREFDRGYSEVTFARIAAQTAAREAVIHKEFHLSSGDPKIVGADKVKKIGHTNFDVADQLSNLGMEAIHPRAAKILRQADIPLRVANAFEPADPGTLIDAELSGEPGVEMVTGLELIAFEVFEQDMVGVKGYDATILKALTRHGVRIVSKQSNANTITHFLDGSLKDAKRVKREIAEAYPAARVHIQKVALVSAVGRDLSGLPVSRAGLEALAEAGIAPMAMQQSARAVDVQFVVGTEERVPALAALHRRLIEQGAGIAPTIEAGAAAPAPALKSAA